MSMFSVSKMIGQSALLVAALSILAHAQGVVHFDAEDPIPLSTPAPDYQSPLNYTSQPYWHTYCVDPPDLEDKLVNVILGPISFHPRQVIDRAMSERGKFVAAMIKHKNLTDWPQKPKGNYSRRRKRSVLGWSRSATGSDQKAALLFKRPKHHLKMATKKTSFAAWSPSLNNHAKYKSRHNRYFVAPQEVAPSASITTTPAPAPPPPPSEISPALLNQTMKPIGNLTKEEEELVEWCVANNIRLSWHLSCALNSCHGPRRMAAGLRNELALELEADHITRTDVDQFEAREYKWRPDVDKLIRRGRSRGQLLYVGAEMENILVNVSHYFQIFNVAFEQMEFDAKKPVKNKTRWNQTNQLTRLNLKILCALDQAVDAYRSVRAKLANRTMGVEMKIRQRVPRPTPIRTLLDQLAKDGEEFRSPLEKHVEEMVAQGQDPLQVHLEREIMPLEVREIDDKFDRNLRDWLILRDYEKLLLYYESVLGSAYS